MSNIDKEWLKQKIADMEAARDEILFGLDEDDSNTLAALRIALASLEAEPVGTFRKGPCGYSPSFHEDAMPLYTAPPAPVSVPDYPETLPCPVVLEPGLRFGKGVNTRTMLGALQRRAEYHAELEAMTPEQRAEHDAGMKEFAAMLQAEPVSNSDELPLDYLQGHKDGLEWAAQLAEANHPQTGDWLYDDPIELARAIRKGPDMPTAQDGNSPVTPDGWIPVSERMPNDKDFVWCWGYVSGWTESDGFEAYYDATRNKWWTIDDETVRKVTHWMPLPAAPQQEVK